MKGKVESNIFQGLSKSTPMQLSMAEGAILESKWKRTGSQPCSRKKNFVSVRQFHYETEKVKTAQGSYSIYQVLGVGTIFRY